MKNLSKIIIIAATSLVILAAVFIIADLYVGNFLVNYSIGRSGDGGNRNVSLDVGVSDLSDIEKIIEENTQIQKQLNLEFENSGVLKETFISTANGIALKGFYAMQDEATNLWVITIHGYKGSHNGVMKLSQGYYSRGFNILSPDLQACGESQGNYVGMGWTDKDDILLWVDWILSQDKNAKILIHGISMGAATTMMVSGENTPDNVIAFIEDCGYTSVWDIFASELKLRFHLPAFPVLYTASSIAKSKAGYSFKEASALEQVKKCQKPMFFIHGNKDDFVPFYMLQKLYDAKPGNNKVMHQVEGAGHDKCYYVLGQTYWDYIFDFLNKYYF